MPEETNHKEREAIIAYTTKEEGKRLLEMLDEDKRIEFETFEPKSIDAPLIIGIISGFISALNLLLRWYETTKESPARVEVKRSDGTRIRVTSKNAKELKVLIEEAQTP